MKVPDFTSEHFKTHRTDEQLQVVILKGGGEVGLSDLMPPWENILEPGEVNALVQLIRNMGK